MLFSITLNTKKGKYHLKALIEHLGGSTGGHYITYKVFSGKWYQCSDLFVKEVPESEVLAAQPYMLFYQFNK